MTRVPQRLAASLPPVVLPQLWLALAGELSRWQQPGVDPEQPPAPRPNGERAGDGPLAFREPRRFGLPRAGALPPRALIDGTGDEELLALLFEMDVLMVRAKARSATQHAPYRGAHR